MELIRTNQVPSYVTYPQMQKLHTLQVDVTKQASFIYNDMYRDRKNSQFVICDTGNAHLDGRIGYVDWFDETHVKYRVLVCARGFSDYENTIPMKMKPENMESMVTVDSRKYNKIAKRDNSHVRITNFLPNNSNHMFQVNVCHDAFRYICNIHEHPETVSKIAFITMAKILGEKEEKERENEANVANQKEEYTKCMDAFFSSHDPVVARPRKMSRRRSLKTNHVQDVQVKSVWKAKFEHIRASMNSTEDKDDEHLFTFPFATCDNSLISCSEGLVELNEHHIEGEHHDMSLANGMKIDPVVITTTSVQSLSPGLPMNEDIFNFCLKW